MKNLIFKTLYQNSKIELDINKSKFIASAYPVKSQIEATNRIEEISRVYHDATHNCYAYIISDETNLYEKFSDDGEPSGTAGLPILQTLKNKSLINSLIIVTRYYGGIKLGKGGLVRAYTNASLLAIENAKIAIMKKHCIYNIEINYNYKNIIDKIIKNNNLFLENVIYLEKISMIINIDIEIEDKIIKKMISATNGEIKYEKISTTYKSIAFEY